MPGLIIDKVGNGASIDKHYGSPVLDLVELAALDQPLLSDKQRRYVHSENCDYYYSANLEAGDVAPDDQKGGKGFWMRDEKGKGDVIKLENIQALKDYPEPQDKLTAEVLGYSSPGDGGGGVFYWNEFSEEDANGSTVIQIVGINIGRWKRLIGNYVDFRWFGSKGNGITDETLMFNSFLNFLNFNGGNGFIPKGRYLIDPFLLDGNIKSFNISGEDKASTFLVNKSGGNLLSFWNCNSINVTNITLEGNHTSLVAQLLSSGHGFVFYNCNNCTAKDLNAVDFKGTGFIGYTDSTTTGIIYKDVFFQDCYAEAAFAQSRGEDCNGILISDYHRSGIIRCVAENITSFGIELKQNARFDFVTDCKAINCGIGFGMGQTTIGVDGCDFNSVSNFQSKDCKQGGVIGEATNNNIDGFLIDMSGVLEADQVDGFRFSGLSSYNSVVGLKTNGMRKPAVSFYNAKNNTVYLENCSDNGGAFKSVAHSADAVNNRTVIGNIEGHPQDPNFTNIGIGNAIAYLGGGQFLGSFGRFYQQAGVSGGAVLGTATHIKEATGGIVEQLIGPVSGSYSRNIGFGATTSYASELINSASGYWQLTINGASYRWSSGACYPVQDNVKTLGTSANRWANVYGKQIRPGSGVPIWTSGTGSPEGVVTAGRGSLFLREDESGAFYKEGVSGVNGWVKILTEKDLKTPVQKIYGDLNTMYADQANQTKGYAQYVINVGHFEYLGTTNANETDYRVWGGNTATGGTIDVAASRNLTAADNAKTLLCTGDIILTMPTGLGKDFTCNFRNIAPDTGVVQILGGAGFTLTAPHGNKLLVHYSANLIKKTDAEVGYLEGELTV